MGTLATKEKLDQKEKLVGEENGEQRVMRAPQEKREHLEHQVLLDLKDRKVVVAQLDRKETGEQTVPVVQLVQQAKRENVVQLEVREQRVTQAAQEEREQLVIEDPLAQKVVVAQLDRKETGEQKVSVVQLVQQAKKE